MIFVSAGHSGLFLFHCINFKKSTPTKFAPINLIFSLTGHKQSDIFQLDFMYTIAHLTLAQFVVTELVLLLIVLFLICLDELRFFTCTWLSMFPWFGVSKPGSLINYIVLFICIIMVLLAIIQIPSHIVWN